MLFHHRDLYDDAVVVDTGPGGQETGLEGLPKVRLHHHDWQDDFAEARNRGLELARGEQILVLDCDERIDPADFVQLRRVARDQPRSCHYFPQLNYFPARRGHGWEAVGPEHRPYALGAPGFHAVWTPRLFPRDPGIRYQGAVHETMEKTGRRAGLNPVRHSINIHHQGHMLPYDRPEGRTEFYGRLLRKKLRRQPDDPYTRYEMAVHLAGTGQDELAASLLKNTLSRFGVWGTSNRALLLLGDIHCRRGEVQRAARSYEAALRQRPQWLAPWEAVVSVHLKMGQGTVALRYLEEARKLFPLHGGWEAFQAQVFGLLDDNQGAVAVNLAARGEEGSGEA